MSDAGLSPMAPVDVPDGYPRDLEQWVDLADGDRVFVRPMIPEDVARIQYAFEHADIDSVRRRFFTAAPPSDRAHMEYLATVDFDRRLALLAMDDQGNSIGVARYEQESEGEAEIAIVVAPGWRRKGVASMLVSLLDEPARSHGFTVLKAYYLPSNKAVEKMLISIGYAPSDVTDGVACLRKPIA